MEYMMPFVCVATGWIQRKMLNCMKTTTAIIYYHCCRCVKIPTLSQTQFVTSKYYIYAPNTF